MVSDETSITPQRLAHAGLSCLPAVRPSRVGSQSTPLVGPISLGAMAVPERNMTIAAFLDYDNLLPAQKMAGILDVVTKALVQMPSSATAHRARCDIPVYGGWYEGGRLMRATPFYEMRADA